MSPNAIRAVVFAVFTAGLLLFVDWIPDDAYISFRYAENFANGHGLVFNPGEHVEGYSNFLWTVVLGLVGRAGFDTVTAAVLLSMTCAFGLILLALRLFELVGAQAAGSGNRPGGIIAVAGLILGSSLPLFFYASSGLETHAAAYFILLGALTHLMAEKDERPSLHAVSLMSFLLVTLLRPEGILFLTLNIGVLLIRYRGRPPRPAVFAILVCVALFAAYLLGKNAYYDSILPNTYWAKPSFHPGYNTPLARGVRSLARYAQVSGMVLVLPLAIFAFARSRMRYSAVYLSALVVAQLVFIIYVGNDVLRFDRFTVAFTAPLIAVILIGAVRARESSAALRTWVPRYLWVALAVILLLGGLRTRRILSKYCYHDWMHSQVYSQIGVALADMLPEGSSIVFNEVGTVAYHSKLPTLDMIGLTNSDVSAIIHRSYLEYGTSDVDWCGERVADYVMAREPTCLILPSYFGIDLSAVKQGGGTLHAVWRGVYEHADFRSLYRPVFSTRINQVKHLYFFVRTDTEVDLTPLERLGEERCVELERY